MGERLTALPKYVVRSRDGRTDWGPTTVIDGDVLEAVAKVRANASGDVLVYASYELVHALLEGGLVDAVHVIVFPHALGSGGRLFHDLTQVVPLHLTGVERVGEELVRLSYDVGQVST